MSQDHPTLSFIDLRDRVLRWAGTDADKVVTQHMPVRAEKGSLWDMVAAQQKQIDQLTGLVTELAASTSASTSVPRFKCNRCKTDEHKWYKCPKKQQNHPKREPLTCRSQQVNGGELLGSLVGDCPHTKVVFNDHPVQCLLDTGSQVTTITSGTLKRICDGREPQLCDISSWLTVKAANGLPLPYSGYVVLDITLLGVTIPGIGVLVLKESFGDPLKANVPGVIGMNVLKKIDRKKIPLSSLPEDIHQILRICEVSSQPVSSFAKSPGTRYESACTLCDKHSMYHKTIKGRDQPCCSYTRSHRRKREPTQGNCCDRLFV